MKAEENKFGPLSSASLEVQEVEVQKKVTLEKGTPSGSRQGESVPESPKEKHAEAEEEEQESEESEEEGER